MRSKDMRMGLSISIKYEEDKRKPWKTNIITQDATI